jgi:hypothetical protein
MMQPRFAITLVLTAVVSYFWGGLTVYKQIFPYPQIQFLKNKHVGGSLKCSNIQNLPPLVDLGPGQTYQGYEGGLYPGGSNVRPAAHDAAGRKIAQSIVLLDANGNPDHVNGKIVYTIESLSNGFPMWHTGEAGYDADTSVTFMTRANADPTKNPQLSIAHGFEYQSVANVTRAIPTIPFIRA